jgi:endonuclease-3
MLSGLKQIIKIDQLLAKKYGKKEFSGGTDPLTELVRTVLSQNTNDTNRDRAYAGLKEAFSSWEEIARAPKGRVAVSIKVAGLAKIRAARIVNLLKAIAKVQGEYNLDFLAEWPNDKIRQYLISLDGIGPKTAACVMAFSLGRNVMPVDTHVYRVSQRLGILPEKTSITAAHDYFVGLGDSLSLYQLHLNLIAHGRQVCHARKPNCGVCCLKSTCNYFKNTTSNKTISKSKIRILSK